jgi:hypothetical protein
MIRLGTILPLFLSAMLACDIGQGPDESKATTQDTFGIYLTLHEVDPTRLDMLSHVEPSPTPLISLDDVVSYTWQTHMIHLTDKGRKTLDTLSISVFGRSFCICVNHSTKYCGCPSSKVHPGQECIMNLPFRERLRRLRID